VTIKITKIATSREDQQGKRSRNERRKEDIGDKGNEAL
jgi:hypothetical protein